MEWTLLAPTKPGWYWERPIGQNGLHHAVWWHPTDLPKSRYKLARDKEWWPTPIEEPPAHTTPHPR